MWEPISSILLFLPALDTDEPAHCGILLWVPDGLCGAAGDTFCLLWPLEVSQEVGSYAPLNMFSTSSFTSYFHSAVTHVCAFCVSEYVYCIFYSCSYLSDLWW